MLAGFTHRPAIELAERLLARLPPILRWVFYAESGATATEIALKMSVQYWQQSGRPRKQRFVCLSGGYHGETLGALAVTDIPLYRDPFAGLLHAPFLVPSPESYARPPELSAEAWSAACLARLAEVFEAHADEIAGLIVEPLVQGASGLRMYPEHYLVGARALCDRHQVHLIADEIATGMYRTGRFLALEHAGVAPDFLLLGKGLSGGFLPLSVVVTTDAVYQAFYADYVTRRAFLHSHTYTGNPLACRAALATLDLIDAPDFPATLARIERQLARALQRLSGHPHVGEIRQRGTLAAIELAADPATRRPFPWQERRGLRVYRHGLERGVLLRPLGQVVYFVPPYVITSEEIEFMVEVAAEGIDRATRD